MHISRRNALIGLGVSSASLVIPSGAARANLATDNWPALRPIVARHWQGYGKTSTAGTVDGELTVGLAVDLNPDADMRIDGRLRMTSRWDTGTYSAVQAISGYCWGTDDAVGVLIENSRFVSGDDLPEGLYWQGLTGKLQLFLESGTRDSWILDGTLSGTRDGNAFETQLSDHA